MDKVVSAVSHRDFVLVFMENGKVHKITYDESTMTPMINVWLEVPIYQDNPPQKTLIKYSADDLLISDYLYRSILKFSPNHKKPSLAGWAAEFEKIKRIDKRSPEEIKSLIDFAHADSFWRSNILSPAKLRKQWDRLTIKKNGTSTDKTMFHPAMKDIPDVV